MIKTDDQRRWWFATHPEYSENRKGGRGRRQREDKDQDDKVRPEGVDGYVDNALKYRDESERYLLKLVKEFFGTDADPSKGGQSTGASQSHRESGIESRRSDDFSLNNDYHIQRPPFGRRSSRFGYRENGWFGVAGYHPNGGLIVPRIPSFEEVSRWPQDTLRGLFRWFDAFLKNNPLLIDPNALERHHGLPKRFIKYFKDAGIKIEDFIIIMTVAKHRLKPDGVHTGKGRGGGWNREWEEFIDDNPLTYTSKDKERVEEKLREMMKKYEIDEKDLLPPKVPKR